MGNHEAGTFKREGGFILLIRKKVFAFLVAFMVLASLALGSATPVQAAGYWSEVCVVSTSDTSISLSWQRYQGAEQYEVRYGKETITENCVVIKNASQTCYTINCLTPGTKYYIRVDCVAPNFSARYFSRLLCISTVQKVVCYYPVTVRYYRDSISDANLIGLLPLGSAEVGTVIGNVDMTRFAPAGYITPGTRSGDYTVAPRENIVNVVYIKPQVKMSMVTVIYLKGSLEMITSECFETPLPPGTPVSALNIDRTKYAPSPQLYYVPGEMIGDSVIQESQCTVLLVWYRARPQ